MTRWSGVLVTLLGIFVSATSSLALGESSLLDTVKQRGTLNAGLRNDFPPLGFINQQGEWVGFEIELAQHIADRLGVRLNKVPVTPATRIAMLVNGNVDFATLMNPTRERAKVIDFTQPYFIGGQGILTKKGSSIKGVADLRKPIKTGSVQGSQDATSIMLYQPEAEIVYFQEYPQAFLALQSGRIDAMSTTTFTLARFAKDRPEFVLLPPFKPDPLAMGVRQNDSKWRNFLTEAIMDAWCDGTISKLYEKYVGGDLSYELFIWPDYYGQCPYLDKKGKK